MTAAAGCSWTGVSNNTSWLTVTSGASGSGNGTVAFSAAANASTTQRSGTLTVAGQTFTVTQAGDAVHVCNFTREPVGGRRWRHGFHQRDDGGRVFVDGGQQQHVLADGDERRERQWEWYGCVQCGGQCEHDAAQRHAHGRGPDVHRDAGGRAVHVCDLAREPVGGRRWRHRFDGGDDTDRVFVDGGQQQHVLADGDERRER